MEFELGILIGVALLAALFAAFTVVFIALAAVYNKRTNEQEERIKKCQDDLVRLVSVLAHYATKTDVKDEVIRTFRANADA